MAGKTITKGDLEAAVDAHCAANGMLHSHGEEKPNKITIFKETPQPGDPMVWLEDGRFHCSDTEFGLSFMNEWLQEAAKGPNLPASTPRNNGPNASRKANGGQRRK
jgi:hypothetical protein